MTSAATAKGRPAPAYLAGSAAVWALVVSLRRKHVIAAFVDEYNEECRHYAKTGDRDRSRLEIRMGEIMRERSRSQTQSSVVSTLIPWLPVPRSWESEAREVED
jgi:hypothetical protein